MPTGYVNGCFVKIPSFFDITFENPFDGDAKRLERERDIAVADANALRTDRLRLEQLRNDCLSTIGNANVINQSELNGMEVGLHERCRRLRQFAEMAEAAEADLRAEVVQLREELALVSSALASLTDRFANAA